jgi:hydrogenase nickel incorporation protein HypA/HybF
MTSWIVDALLELTTKQQAKRVLEVNLRIGKLRVLSIDQVKFCYGILTKGTVLEGSKLVVEETAGKVRCGSCGYSGEFNPEGDAYHFGIPPLICPTCGGSLAIEGGDECVITRVRMELPSETKQTPPVS